MEVKDKGVTVEGLSELHNHSKETYMTKENPSGTGSFSMDGNAWFTGDVYVEGSNKVAMASDLDMVTRVVDLGNAPIQYEPHRFTSFILESVVGDNLDIVHIIFTKRIVDTTSLSLDTRAYAFEFDENGNINRHEIYFYWGDGGYMVDVTTTQFSIGTGQTKTSLLPYDKIYGVDYCI